MSLHSNRNGCEEGEREHRRKIDELNEEARNLLDHAESGTFDPNDQRRLDDIQAEIIRREYEINRMK
ncbi:hypothetical protein AB9Q52_010980 [Pantoea vagans]|uniref:hypothetical protein n=1 Tax=Pantoea vagans TaxID=470934 RepID=UPI003518B9C0